MRAIPLAEAIEQLAGAVETASAVSLVEFYAELYPSARLPDADKITGLARQMAEHIRHDFEPEEVVDLWNVVFPETRGAFYDEETGTLRQSARRLRYAGH